MIDQLLKLTLRDSHTQRTKTSRVVLLAEAHLHVGCVVTYPHLEWLRLSTDIHKVLRSLVHIRLDRNGHELHILNGVAKVNLIDHISFIDLDIHNLGMDIELWFAAVCRIGQ